MSSDAYSRFCWYDFVDIIFFIMFYIIRSIIVLKMDIRIAVVI